MFTEGAETASIEPRVINYSHGGATPFTSLKLVYATGETMKHAHVMQPNFNLTWKVISIQACQMRILLDQRSLKWAMKEGACMVCLMRVAPLYRHYPRKRDLKFALLQPGHCIIFLGIIHCNEKTTNILFDGKIKAAPMEQADVSTAVKGSFRYLDHEYFRKQQLIDKSDFYTFGVVLFARPVISPKLPREQISFAGWAMNCYRIIDSNIAENISSESLKKKVEAAEKYLAEFGMNMRCSFKRLQHKVIHLIN